MDQNQTFQIKQGALLPVIQGTAYDGAGRPLNLTGATVTFRMVNRATGVVKLNNVAATLVDARAGIVRYTWVGTDTDTVGIYDAEFTITLTAKALKIPVDGNITVQVTAPP